MKNARAYGTAGRDALRTDGELSHNHFGLIVVSCERADLRPLPNGVMVYGDEARHLEEIPPPKIPRKGVVDEFYDAAMLGTAPLHSGEWGLATLEICRAILGAAESGSEVELRWQA